jgi:hypothetical protein
MRYVKDEHVDVMRETGASGESDRPRGEGR